MCIFVVCNKYCIITQQHIINMQEGDYVSHNMEWLRWIVQKNTFYSSEKGNNHITNNWLPDTTFYEFQEYPRKAKLNKLRQYNRPNGALTFLWWRAAPTCGFVHARISFDLFVSCIQKISQATSRQGRRLRFGMFTVLTTIRSTKVLW